MAALILASQNPHKLAELRVIFPDLEPLAADEWPEETGATYEENARIKAWAAQGYAPASWTVGEDSGIECDALGGAPGIRSARWTEGDQAEALLARLAGERERGARMRTVLVALSPDGDELVAEGVLEGTIAHAKRGNEGFGYDPIFIPTGLTQTVAELGEEWKHEHSHRARAGRALADAFARAGRS